MVKIDLDKLQRELANTENAIISEGGPFPDKNGDIYRTLYVNNRENKLIRVVTTVDKGLGYEVASDEIVDPPSGGVSLGDDGQIHFH